MRVLVVEPGPAFSVADVHRGICNGLAANGVDVRSFNLGDRLSFYSSATFADGAKLEHEAAARLASQGVRAACWDWGPDVVIIVSSFFVPPDVFASLRRRGVHVVLWLTEAPYEDARQIPQAAHADTVIVNDPVNIDRYRAVQPRTWYLPHSYDPAIHHADGRSDEHPFGFVGTGYQSRIDFLEATPLPDGSVLAGNWQQLAEDSPLLPYVMHERGQCVDNADTARIYRRCATSANLYRVDALDDTDRDGWAIGPREVELAACGTWFARDARGESNDLFPMLPTISDPAELGDAIRWALDHPHSRRVAAAAARAAVADRTFQATTRRLLDLVTN